MRVLEAHLEAALNADAEPYLQLQYCMDDTFTWLDAPYPLYSYKLGDLELNVTTAGAVYYEPFAIRLKRGAYWHKAAHFVTSSAYYVNKVITTQKQQVEIEASIISKFSWRKYSVNGHQTYRQILDDVCTLFGYTTAYEAPASAIWDNIFYPTGRTLTLQNPHAIFNLIRQKLFIYASDNNDNQIYFRQWLDDGNVGTFPFPALETIVTFDWEEYKDRQYRRIFWRDENYTIHSWLDPVTYADLPIYNMGYLESTAATPAIWVTWNRNRDKRTFHLKYQDGDIIQCSSGTYQIQPFEIFNLKESPSLYTQFVALPKFTTTEGGPLPGTIEAAAPYTPLNVSEFNKNLNSGDNNLQALAEAVDELTTGPAMYAAAAKDPLDDEDLFPVIDSDTTTHLVRKFTWLNLKDRIFTAFGLSVNSAGAKATPVDGDLIPLVDSETAGKLVRYFTWANLTTRVFPAFAPSLHATNNKSTLNDNDEIGILDSASSYTSKHTLWGNVVNKVLAAFGPAVAATADITTPADDDLIPIVDVSPANKPTVKLSWANLITRIFVTMPLSQEVWHEIDSGGGEPAFQNSWVNYDTVNWDTAAFFKDTCGIVHLKGVVKNGTTVTTIFNLPSGYRPNLNTQYPNGIFIHANGNIRDDTGGTTFQLLSGITFRAA